MWRVGILSSSTGNCKDGDGHPHRKEAAAHVALHAKLVSGTRADRYEERLDGLYPIVLHSLNLFTYPASTKLDGKFVITIAYSTIISLTRS